MTKRIRWTGAEAYDPVLSLHWDQGEVREIEEVAAVALLTIDGFEEAGDSERPRPEDTPYHEGMPEREE